MSQWVENSVLHLDVDLTESSQTLEVDLVGGGSGRFPYYKGEYEIDPRKVEQVLPTKDKSMSADVVIHPIFYSETGNLSGGFTAYIGME